MDIFNNSIKMLVNKKIHKDNKSVELEVKLVKQKQKEILSLNHIICDSELNKRITI